MQSLNTFIRISGPISEVKKICIDQSNDCERIAYWEESEHREVLANKFSLSQIQLGGLGLVATPGKFCNFSLLLSLETVVPSLKLTQNCYLNMNILFKKNGNLTINWVPYLFYKHTFPETLSSKSMGLQKFQFLNSLVNWEKFGSAT